LNNMGKCLSAQNHTEEGLTYFNQAVQVDPDNLEARYNLATGLLLLNRKAEAVSELNELLRRDPTFEPALNAQAALRAEGF